MLLARSPLCASLIMPTPHVLLPNPSLRPRHLGGQPVGAAGHRGGRAGPRISRAQPPGTGAAAGQPEEPAAQYPGTALPVPSTRCVWQPAAGSGCSQWEAVQRGADGRVAVGQWRTAGELASAGCLGCNETLCLPANDRAACNCSTRTPHAPVCRPAAGPLPKPPAHPRTQVLQAAEVWQQSERWMESGGAPPVETWCLFGTGAAAGERVTACQRGFNEAWRRGRRRAGAS